MRGVTGAVADPYSPDSLSGRARGRRWKEVVARYPSLSDMRVLDLGGDARAWRLAPIRPLQVVLVNTFPQEDLENDWMRAVAGDACQLPSEIRAEDFDLVYSNSVVEHVGGHWRRTRFSEEVREAAPHHWIQTPYRYFPLEPHWLFPGFQLLPVRLRAEITRRWPVGNYQAVRHLDEAVTVTLRTEMVSETEMRHYFPTSEIWRERVLGLPKSLVAIK